LHRIAVNTVLEKRRGPSNAEIAVEDPTEYEEAVLSFDTARGRGRAGGGHRIAAQGARDALVLCGVYGYEHSEAASMLGIAVGPARRSCIGPRGLLRERLERGVR
jgi:DNA-directed RNA polymerase specialized sigma24 family protein